MTTPYYSDDLVTLYHGDCLDILAELPDNSIDAVVTDPPYGLANTDPTHVAETIVRWVNGDRDYLPGGSGFMGKAWDAFVPPVAVWDECLRVLKPGGHVLAFAGSRTVDLMTLGIRLAGFEVRDSIAWLYGSGFPKSLDVSKAIDKAAGAEREVVGTKFGLPGYSLTDGNGDHRTYSRGLSGNTSNGADECAVTAPATEAAARWQGWGTALKPSHEPIVVARKPLAGTVAANVLEHGTGALNIDATRVETADNLNGGAYSGAKRRRDEYTSTDTAEGAVPMSRLNRGIGEYVAPSGRWPANVVLDDTQAAELDRQSGNLKSGVLAAHHARAPKEAGILGAYGSADGERGYGDTGGASRFFPTFRYQAKAPARERPRVDGTAHPTVKPLDLMRWLVRLVTPPGGTVLEPFAGSGTTVEACLAEGFRCVAIEREADYLPLIEQRINRHHATPRPVGDPSLFDLEEGA